MRTLAVSVAALLVLAVVSPAFAQPFADVPTDHWAFDAIAELAAKGIIEGFPDGTFKGERGVTRYELAMVVARILARIEAIKVPAPSAPAAPSAPSAPQVTRADVQTIQRLVNEFRAELAALGVRVTAVEEELTALKTSVSATKVGGDVRFRYNFFPNSNASNSFRDRLTFTGTVSPDVKMVTRARFNGWVPPSSLPSGISVSFDRAYLAANLLGFNWRAGQWDYTLGTGVGWSGYGLLMDPGNAGEFFSGTSAFPVFTSGNNPLGYISGLTAGGSLAGFTYELGAWNAQTTMNIFTARVDTNFAGWTVSADAIYQNRIATTSVPEQQPGTTEIGTLGGTGVANTNDTGYEIDVSGDLFPGLTLGGGYATFNPNTPPSSNAYIGWLAFDLSPMGMAGWKATAWYKNYGGSAPGTQIPYFSGATTETDLENLTDWNFKGWGVALDANFGSGWSGSFVYESGNQTVTPQDSIVEYYATIGYALAPNTKVSFNWFKGTVGGPGVVPAVDYDNFYRIQLTTSY